MAKTNAERQKAYRQRNRKSLDHRRLNTWLDKEAHFALARLARRYGVTKKEVLEKLILRDDRKFLKQIGTDEEKFNEYFDTEP